MLHQSVTLRNQNAHVPIMHAGVGSREVASSPLEEKAIAYSSCKLGPPGLGLEEAYQAHAEFLITYERKARLELDLPPGPGSFFCRKLLQSFLCLSPK